MPLLVARNFFYLHCIRIPFDFQLLRPQCPRPNKTHISFKDVYELGKFVHSSGSYYPAHPRNSGIILNSLDWTNPAPWLFTLPTPIAVVVASAGTVTWTLSKLDPVAIIERR